MIGTDKHIRGNPGGNGVNRLGRMAALTLLLTACQPGSVDYGDVFDGTAGQWVDLTHAFGASTIYWPTDTTGFQLEELAFGQTEGGWFYSSYAFASAEHGGTHLDAPIHFAEGRLSNDEIPLSGLMGPAVVVDVTDHATPDYAGNWRPQGKYSMDNRPSSS